VERRKYDGLYSALLVARVTLELIQELRRLRPVRRLSPLLFNLLGAVVRKPVTHVKTHKL
jgi:hypothetical protein